MLDIPFALLTQGLSKHARNFQIAGLLAVLSAPLSLAQTGPCDSLRHFDIPAGRIGLPTQGAVVRSAKTAHTHGHPFCKVFGEIRSVDPAAQPIRFEVNLPDTWNGKALQMGGGVFDGALSLTNGLGMQTMGAPETGTPLERGFVTFGGDSGHHHHYILLPDALNALQARFALNAEERRNFNKDGLKKTHDAAVAIIERRYVRKPSRMFFIGGSTGGREAFFVTQQWPDDYDGVLGAYAGWNQVQLDLQFIRVSQAQYAPGGWLPTSKTKLLAQAVMNKCDALDGLRDGIIGNLPACHFDPATLVCPSAGDTKHCLTPGQLRTVQIFASEQRTAFPLFHGVQSIPGYNILVGADLTGNMGLLRHPFHPPIVLLNSFYYLVADGVLRFFLTQNPKYDALKFDTTTGVDYKEGLLEQSAASDASDADLSRFAAHGGKFLMLHGTADTVIPTGASVEFYTMLEAKMGKPALDTFMRFYLIPGFGHGSGVLDAQFDALGILDRWVETGSAPENLTVQDGNAAGHRRTRPLCVYPKWPKYLTGDTAAAASFTCSD